MTGKNMKDKKRLFKVIAAIFLITGSAFFLTGCTTTSVTGEKTAADQDTVSDSIEDRGGKEDPTSDLKDENGKVDKDQAVNSHGRYTGKYRIRFSGITGILIIEYREKRFHGTLQFTTWGRGLQHPLKELVIKDNKIFFIRSITTPEELQKYGSGRYFKQKYSGKFSPDFRVIKGYFVDVGAEVLWEARKY